MDTPTPEVFVHMSDVDDDPTDEEELSVANGRAHVTTYRFRDVIYTHVVTRSRSQDGRVYLSVIDARKFAHRLLELADRAAAYKPYVE